MIVEGIAGQGKSMFLRYLTAAEMRGGQAIPIFVELRRIGQRSLDNLIDAELKALGFRLDEQALADMYKNGKIILLLDAFDECPEEHRPEVVGEIELKMRSCDRLRVLVSSR